MDNFEYNNENDDNDENDDVPNHDYHAEYRSIAGMGAGEEDPPTQNEVLDGQILECGEWGILNNGDDGKDINKCDGLPSDRPHGTALGPSLSRITENLPP